MKVIYVLKNPETMDGYVGQTSSLARRLTQHVANGILILLQSPTTMPLFILIKTGKLILEVFISKGDYRQEEKDTIAKARDDGYTLHNKQHNK